MTRKTEGVYMLAAAVLESMSPPYSEDIIEDVFLAIESDVRWMQRYETLVTQLGKYVVNNWMGKYVKEIADMETIREVPARRSRLIKDYSQLEYRPA